MKTSTKYVYSGCEKGAIWQGIPVLVVFLPSEMCHFVLPGELLTPQERVRIQGEIVYAPPPAGARPSPLSGHKAFFREGCVYIYIYTYIYIFFVFFFEGFRGRNSMCPPPLEGFFLGWGGWGYFKIWPCRGATPSPHFLSSLGTCTQLQQEGHGGGKRKFEKPRSTVCELRAF